MRVRKRDGSMESVMVGKIIKAIERCAAGLSDVDPMRVAVKTIGGIHDGSTTRELDMLSIGTAASLVLDEPDYSRLAARLMIHYIDKEVQGNNVFSFSQSIELAWKAGQINKTTYEFVTRHARKLNSTVKAEYSDRFEYFGIRTVYDRYLLKDRATRLVTETPQYFFMRVACGLSDNVRDAVQFYNLIATLDYLPSTPTLLNSGGAHPQMSSCFLLDSPQDTLDSIYDHYTEIARLSKFSGGIGSAWHRVRSNGSPIRGTNGKSNGIVPWVRTLDASVAAVNQGGVRKGACCIYLETWHADIEDFLELRDNTGDAARRTWNLNLAHWIPDLFMERVEQDGLWSLFDPACVPALPDLYGQEFRVAYEAAETSGLYRRQVKARDLYARMMRTLAETGNGWMTFKDSCNTKSNQTGAPGNVIHLSNLCTEILEVTSDGETAVCNLGSINLAHHISDGKFDFVKLNATVRTAVPFLDRVIDRTAYQTARGAVSNRRWRPVGLGVMGLQDCFYKLELPFDSEEASRLSAAIQQEIYYSALSASADLAEEFGPHETFGQTRAAAGVLQYCHWGVLPQDLKRWTDLQTRIKKTGLRNSLLIAIAPTATIASIAGCFECIEPSVSNLFKRETMSGDFLQINRYLVNALKAVGMWNEQTRDRIKTAGGSVQSLTEIPADLRRLYRTVWELPMKAIIDMAAARAAWIDQSQSLNLFMESPNIGRLSSMYMHAWKRGLKTTYYLRSRPATEISRITTSGAAGVVACSLDNPETCEACQ